MSQASTKAIKNLNLNQATQALKAPGPASQTFPSTVKGVTVHYHVSKFGKSRFIRTDLPRLVYANPTLAWSTHTIPTVKKSTKDPKLHEAAANYKEGLAESASGGIQQKVMIEFEDGSSKLIPIGRKSGSEPLSMILRAVGLESGTSEPSSAASTKSKTQPFRPLSSLLSQLDLPPNSTSTSSPAANNMTLSEADLRADAANLPKPSSVTSENSGMTESEEEVKADLGVLEGEKEVDEMVKQATGAAEEPSHPEGKATESEQNLKADQSSTPRPSSLSSETAQPTESEQDVRADNAQVQGLEEAVEKAKTGSA